MGLAAVPFASLALSLALIAPVPVHAQSQAAAHAFVLGLYQAYEHDPSPDYLGAKAARVFSPDLLVLIRRDAARTPAGDVPSLEGDPICDCQDEEITKVEVAIAETGKGHAQATARLLDIGKWRVLKLDLVAVRGSWRVSDVHTDATPSLVAFLKNPK